MSPVNMPYSTALAAPGIFLGTVPQRELHRPGVRGSGLEFWFLCDFPFVFGEFPLSVPQFSGLKNEIFGPDRIQRPLDFYSH